MEVTKWLKPSISVSRIGDSASVQAATRVNAEQASKMSMCRPTRRPFRGRLTRLGEMSEEYTQLLHRGSGGSMYTRKVLHTDRSDIQRHLIAHFSALSWRKPLPFSNYETNIGRQRDRLADGPQPMPTGGPYRGARYFATPEIHR